MLQAQPDTALWLHLAKQGRLINVDADINQTTVINFIPTRPIEEIVRAYIDTFWQLYDPVKFLERIHLCYKILADTNFHKKKRAPKPVRWGSCSECGVHHPVDAGLRSRDALEIPALSTGYRPLQPWGPDEPPQRLRLHRTLCGIP